MADGNGTGKRRELWLDVLRVAAACAVVMMHTLTGAVDIFNVSGHAYGKLMLIIMDLVTWCVPVFLMISGYLFLKPGKEIPFQTMVGKYCLRIVLALLVFGIPFSCLELILAEKTFRFGMIWDGFLMVLTWKSWSHLWYLYLILSLYLLTPAIAWILKKVPVWSVAAAECVLVVGGSVFPWLNQVWSGAGLPVLPEQIWSGAGLSVLPEQIGNGGQLPALPDQAIYLFYYLFGYLLHAEGIKKIKKQYKGLTACTVALVLGMIVYRLSDARQIQMAYNYPPTVMLAVSFMMLGRMIDKAKEVCRVENGDAREQTSRMSKEPQKLTEKLILNLSQLSFGIYLVHPVFLNIFYKFLHVTPAAGNFALRFPLFFAVTFLAAAGTAWMMRKISLLRRYVL